MRAIVLGLVGSLVAVAAMSQQPTTGARTRVVEIPIGAIVAFDAQSCPKGWEPYQKASGHFLRGVTVEKPHGTTGGSEQHHHSGKTGDGRNNARNVDNDCCDRAASNWEHSHSYTTDEEDHTPLFVSVLWCRLK